MKQMPVSNLASYNSRTLREMSEPVTVCVHREPIAVLVPLKVYEEWKSRVDLDDVSREAMK